MSLAVTQVSPRQSNAGSNSMERMRACATGERTVRPKSWPGKVKSSSCFTMQIPRWVAADGSRPLRLARARDGPYTTAVIPLRDTVPTRRFPLVTTALIAANVLVLIHEAALGPGLHRAVQLWGLVPA